MFLHIYNSSEYRNNLRKETQNCGIRRFLEFKVRVGIHLLCTYVGSRFALDRTPSGCGASTRGQPSSLSLFRNSLSEDTVKLNDETAAIMKSNLRDENLSGPQQWQIKLNYASRRTLCAALRSTLLAKKQSHKESPKQFCPCLPNSVSEWYRYRLTEPFNRLGNT